MHDWLAMGSDQRLVKLGFQANVCMIVVKDLSTNNSEASASTN